MTAFFMMYLVNNEYTAKGEQPIQGILCLDNKDAAAKLHYLAREWQYFPGKLLTPEMLKKDPGYYSCYISIGERNEMELGNEEASSYGCGTYRMFLILPEEEKIWAVSLTEVFSAYRIYINGELAGEVGNPDEKSYKDRIMNRAFYISGIRGCGNCHSSSRQKPYQIRNPVHSGFWISVSGKYTERNAGTWKRLCHCIL